VPDLSGAQSEARAAGSALISQGKATGPTRRTFVLVNHRREGNAISTIEAMIQPTTTICRLVPERALQ
jgi:hypothetical protein